MRYETAIPNTPLTREEIVSKLGAEKQVERWIENIRKTGVHGKALEDLAQDTYLFLSEMNKDKIETLYKTGELPFFVNRVLLNNLNSVTSPYYTKYIKPIIHEDLSVLQLTEDTYTYNNNNHIKTSEITYTDKNIYDKTIAELKLD